MHPQKRVHAQFPYSHCNALAISLTGHFTILFVSKRELQGACVSVPLQWMKPTLTCSSRAQSPSHSGLPPTSNSNLTGARSTDDQKSTSKSRVYRGNSSSRLVPAEMNLTHAHVYNSRVFFSQKYCHPTLYPPGWSDMFEGGYTNVDGCLCNG